MGRARREVLVAFLGDYLSMSEGTIYAMAGFAGLGGPALLFAVWDRIIEPMLTRRG